MDEIEQKERELALKESEFRREALEEIKLSDDKQAQVETRKAELQAMLAKMQQLDSEFDELGREFDDQISAILSPNIADFEAHISKVASKFELRKGPASSDSD